MDARAWLCSAPCADAPTGSTTDARPVEAAASSSLTGTAVSLGSRETRDPPAPPAMTGSTLLGRLLGRRSLDVDVAEMAVASG